MSVYLHCGFFIIVLDLRLTKLVRGCRETAFNFLYTFENTKMIIRLFYLILLLFVSCNHSNQKNETIRVSVLRGPSAIAFAAWMEQAPVLDGKVLSVRVIDSPELMQAALIKGETDIAVLPMISAANLYNKGIRYPLLGCPVWGTL